MIHNLIVAIHQPNYLPWLGYFHKIAAADTFVFLDDVQFSKNSYINRCRILGGDGPRWLTVPVSVSLGDPINAVRPARRDWTTAHFGTLRTYYAKAPRFAAVWQDLETIYGNVPDGTLDAINRYMVEAVAGLMGLSCRFVASSEIETGPARGEDRLIGIVKSFAPGATYYSGKGGANYQSTQKFRDAGLDLVYTDFEHPDYDQGRPDFCAGLSVIDCVFRRGWSGAAKLLARR